jgi:hypothetical protein
MALGTPLNLPQRKFSFSLTCGNKVPILGPRNLNLLAIGTDATDFE